MEKRGKNALIVLVVVLVMGLMVSVIALSDTSDLIPTLRADTNGDGTVNLADPLTNLNFQFLGGHSPPPVTPREAAGLGHEFMTSGDDEKNQFLIAVDEVSEGAYSIQKGGDNRDILQTGDESGCRADVDIFVSNPKEITDELMEKIRENGDDDYPIEDRHVEQIKRNFVYLPIKVRHKTNGCMIRHINLEPMFRWGWRYGEYNEDRGCSQTLIDITTSLIVEKPYLQIPFPSRIHYRFTASTTACDPGDFAEKQAILEIIETGSGHAFNDLPEEYSVDSRFEDSELGVLVTIKNTIRAF